MTALGGRPGRSRIGLVVIAALLLAGCQVIDLDPSQDATVSCAAPQSATWQWSGAAVESVLVRCDGSQDGQRVVTCYRGVSSARVVDSSSVAVSCVQPTTAVEVTAGGGGAHSCARKADGTVRCWGSNEFGQLGHGGSLTFSTTPVTVLGITDATAISAGGDFTCALVGAGGVSCWGDNSYRQLGNVDVDFSAVPLAVSGITDAIAIETGFSHACAVRSSGAITCWGNNASGQLGGGFASEPSLPVTVVGITDAIGTAATLDSTCALSVGGAVHCWGGNSRGQLGNGTMVSSLAPMAVAGLPAAVDLAAGTRHVCVALAGGAVACWGHNTDLQLGATGFTSSSTPVTVSGLADVVSVSAGSSHSCAVQAGGAIRCWGSNGTYGKLGDGTNLSSAATVIVASIAVATDMDAADSHSCALAVGGAVRCWGYNGAGQLGNGTQTLSGTPSTVVGL